jgi:hypothetical protein
MANARREQSSASTYNAFAPNSKPMSALLAFFTVTVLGADMLPGTWKLNVAKSKYSPGPAPQSNTVKFEAIAGGVKLTADGVDSQGKKTHNEYTAKFDGKDNPAKPMLDGKPNPNAADSVAYKKSTTTPTKSPRNSKGNR